MKETQKMTTAQKDDELVFLPLGGTGEIGMNLNLFGYGPAKKRKWLMVDLGVTFSDGRTPGVDVIMPDPAFIEEHVDDLLAIVLTHGHEDHIGAVAHLWPRLKCPVYATPFTAELVKGKLIEAGLEDTVPFHIIDLSERFQIGPFDIELVTLTHSILEPNALAIRTPLGMVFHTGDWKIDEAPQLGEDIDIKRLTEIGEEGVLAMVCDSTNVFSPGSSGSEAEVAATLKELLPELTGRVAITTFASNAARLESIIRAAEECGRHVVLAGRSMHRIISAARSCGYFQNIPPFLRDDEARKLPKNKVLYLCTGSQGEPRAALSRIANDTHPQVIMEEGDTVIFSSKIIPGNDVAIYELQNQLAERGIRIITEKDHMVHVSGHPCRGELTQMYEWIKPHIAVPVHGEARHLLEHADLADELKVPHSALLTNGDLLRIAPGNPEIIAEVESGRLYLDGDILIPSWDPSIQSRRRLAVGGAVFVALVLDEQGHDLGQPQIRIMGLPERDGSGEKFVNLIHDAIDDTLDRLPLRKRKDDGVVAELIRRAVRGVVRRQWGKKTAVEVAVSRLENE